MSEKEMKIIYKKVDEIVPYEKNPRNNDDAVDFVANSIKEFGFRVPIIIDKDNVIVTGHTRLKAAQKLGMTEVPCLLADDLTEEQIKKFRIADNKTGEIAFWDNELLKEEFLSMDDFSDMADFGFGDFELNILTGDYEPEEYDNELIQEYSNDSEDFLKNKRVIITYKTDEETEFLKKILKEEDTELGVVYKIQDIMEKYDE